MFLKMLSDQVAQKFKGRSPEAQLAYTLSQGENDDADEIFLKFSSYPNLLFR